MPGACCAPGYFFSCIGIYEVGTGSQRAVVVRLKLWIDSAEQRRIGVE